MIKKIFQKRIVRAFIISFVLGAILFSAILFQQIQNQQPERFWTRRVPDGNPSSQNDEKVACKDCNVILITMTNLRYDHMSSNGYFRPTTPNLDNFAKESIVFDNVFSPANWTVNARISIYTGLYPFEHGVMGQYGNNRLSDETLTILDVLKKVGYTNVAFKGDDFLADRYDEHQGCIPDAESPYQRVSQRHYGSVIFSEFSCSIPKALAWIKKNTSGKFFLHLQGYDVHCPFSQRGGKTFDPDYQGKVDFRDCWKTYGPKEPLMINSNKHYLARSSKEPFIEEVLLSERDVEHMLALYDESIVFADAQVGSLLNEIKNMGLWDNTIIIFTSEHGEMFGKKGLFMRGGTTYYDDVLHVPLIIHHPKLKALRIGGLVSLIDVPQTILDFLGLEKLRSDGKSMTSLILRGEEVRREVFAGSTLTPTASNIFLSNKSYVAVIRTKDWKLIDEVITYEDGSSSNNVELYDILNDKEELYNLADKRLDVLQDMKSRLDMWLRSVRR